MWSILKLTGKNIDGGSKERRVNLNNVNEYWPEEEVIPNTTLYHVVISFDKGANRKITYNNAADRDMVLNALDKITLGVDTLVDGICDFKVIKV
jgi:hypothetical protein